MRGYLLDTNHLSAALNSGSTLCARIVAAQNSGIRVGTCVPVLCELEAGIAASARPDRIRAVLRRLLHRVRVWPLDSDTARIYGSTHLDLRRRGIALSQVDLMLASLCLQNDLVLLTTDGDFSAVDGVRTENWLN